VDDSLDGNEIAGGGIDHSHDFLSDNLTDGHVTEVPVDDAFDAGH
jgi:hypothetical protein